MLSQALRLHWLFAYLFILQSFTRAGRKADVVATGNVLGHDDVNVIHGETVWPDVAPSSKDSGRLCRADLASMGKNFCSDGNSLAWIKQVSAKTANHDLKALKMMFKSARRDSVIADDPTEFVEPVRRERVSKIKRPFTLKELRTISDLASDEWRSMILFGLYSGRRLGDIATPRWGNIDLQRDELRLSTRKTGKAMILPVAAPLRKHIRSLHFAGDPSAPIHPKAFDLVERSTQDR